MKRILQIAALASFSLTTNVPASAAPPEKRAAALRDSLTRLSELLFIANQEHFVIVDALRDGYLNFGENYELSYNPGVVKINGRALPAAANRLYLQRLRDFRLRDNMTPETRYSVVMTGNGFSKSELFDPASEFRKRSAPVADPKKAEAAKSANRIINELLRDRIVADGANFAIRYDSTGLFVNRAALSPAMNEKYRTLFRVMMDIDPQAGTKGYSYSISTTVNGATR